MSSMAILINHLRGYVRDHIIIMDNANVVVTKFGVNIIAESAISCSCLPKSVERDILRGQVVDILQIKSSEQS
jgi:hypothetical protein